MKGEGSDETGSWEISGETVSWETSGETVSWETSGETVRESDASQRADDLRQTRQTSNPGAVGGENRVTDYAAASDGCQAGRTRASARSGMAVRASWFVLAAVLALAGILLPAAIAEADHAEGEVVSKISLDVMLSHISDQPGAIDPRAARLHAKLSQNFRYESLRVLDEQQMHLEINDLGVMTLPTGRRLRVTPMIIDQRGALLAVDLEGSAQVDIRIKRHHLVVIGAQRYQGGRLVISIYPDF